MSTTLSKLAKSGEVTKAARGYQLAAQSSTKAPKLDKRATKKWADLQVFYT